MTSHLQNGINSSLDGTCRLSKKINLSAGLSFLSDMSSNIKNFVLWSIATFLFFEFAIDGWGKLHGEGMNSLTGWGYSCSFIGIIGFFEIVFASGLLIPKSRKIAAFFIVTLTLLSTYIHIIQQDVLGLLINAMNIGLAAMVLWYSSERSHVPLN
ncbi:MAG: DoxX family protein [Bacteroidota bacterium]